MISDGDHKSTVVPGSVSQGSTNRSSSSPLRSRELEALSDEEIMREVQHGNGDAFAVLFDRYHRLVLVTALRIVRDVAEAEEVTQNVFFEIYRTAGNFDPARGTLRVWLLQFAYHRSINRRNYLLLRQFYSRPDFDRALALEEGSRTVPQFAIQEAAQLAEEALATLNEPQRRTIRMVFFEGMTLKEVAERTQESFSNVRNHYYRGLDRLRVSLAPHSVALRNERVSPLGEVSRVKA